MAQSYDRILFQKNNNHVKIIIFIGTITIIRGYRECNMGDTPAEVRGFACIGSSYLEKVPRESLLGVCPPVNHYLDNKRLSTA